MRRFNSRLKSVEEKKNVRSAILFAILTVAVISLIFFVGIPVLGKFTAFVSGLRGGNKQISKTDTTPPAPPKFNYFSASTNQQNITISGSSEAGATITLNFNSAPQEVLTDANGAFSFNLTLPQGISNFSAIATDQAGNISQDSQSFQITFDNKNPELSITSPTDGTSFFGSIQRQVTIQGKTDSGSQVTINDRIISVDDLGNFQYTTTLNEGANQFIIKSTDQAGNTVELTTTYNFTP